MAWVDMENLTKFDKFWVIWSGCLDKPRTIKDIQKVWGYSGNALYQKGLQRPIYEEMEAQGFIKRVSKIKKRGVSGVTLESNFRWIPGYLDELGKRSNFQNNNYIILEILNSIKDKKGLVRFIKDHKEAFFFIDNVKLLFGDKENLKSNYEMIIFAPILVLLNIHAWRILKKKMGVDDNIIFFLTSTFIFNVNPRLNFMDYFLRVSKNLKDVPIPSTIFNQEKIFGTWKKYSSKIKDSLFL